jgi:carotenoid cleavage dioxygenase-like enzyme
MHVKYVKHAISYCFFFAIRIITITCVDQNLIHGEHLIKFDPNKESRLGLLPRYAKDESQIRWFTIPTCMIFHNGKSYYIVLQVSLMPHLVDMAFIL